MDIGRGRSTMNVALWIVQGLLAALFLFAGGAKLLGYAGYSHFFAGDFIRRTGPSHDSGFLHAAIQYTF